MVRVTRTHRYCRLQQTSYNIDEFFISKIYPAKLKQEVRASDYLRDSHNNTAHLRRSSKSMLWVTLCADSTGLLQYVNSVIIGSEQIDVTETTIQNIVWSGKFWRQARCSRRYRSVIEGIRLDILTYAFFMSKILPITARWLGNWPLTASDTAMNPRKPTWHTLRWANACDDCYISNLLDWSVSFPFSDNGKGLFILIWRHQIRPER